MQSTRPLSRLAVSWLCAGAVALAAGSASAQEWKPAKNVDIVVASAAAGSSDRTARVAQKLLQANPRVSQRQRHQPSGRRRHHRLDVPHPASRRRALHRHFFLDDADQPHPGHQQAVSYQDFTPLNILLREYILLAVRTESPITSAKDLLERLKKDVTSVSFAFSSSRGNHNHVIIGMIAKAAGADPRKAKIVIYNSGGDALTAMLGGHVDVLVGAPANALPHIASGKARAIGITASQRQPGRTAGRARP